MRIRSRDSSLGAARAFATCCPKTRERMAKGKSRDSGFGICRLPFAICHFKFSLLISLLICGCLTVSACHKKSAAVPRDPATARPARLLLRAYDTEQDWNDPQHTIALNYQQAQGKRVFYNNCVWCHADATPAGPSNRSNLTPNPPLLNDGTTLNGVSDEFMQNIITLGGSAMGKSAMMSPWGQTLTQDEIRAVIAFARAIAQPPYKPPARPGPQYSVK